MTVVVADDVADVVAEVDAVLVALEVWLVVAEDEAVLDCDVVAVLVTVDDWVNERVLDPVDVAVVEADDDSEVVAVELPVLETDVEAVAVAVVEAELESDGVAVVDAVENHVQEPHALLHHRWWQRHVCHADGTHGVLALPYRLPHACKDAGGSAHAAAATACTLALGLVRKHEHTCR